MPVIVIPAEAGIHPVIVIPAEAGIHPVIVIPAEAGIQWGDRTEREDDSSDYIYITRFRVGAITKLDFKAGMPVVLLMNH